MLDEVSDAPPSLDTNARRESNPRSMVVLAAPTERWQAGLGVPA
jgi:hypothetical protein